MTLENKKVAILGDRDGVPGQAIEEIVKSMNGEVVFSTTECFVWTSAGAMDLENQGRIKELNEKYGEDLVVVIGAGESEAAALAAETVTSGDPTFAGPLAGLALNVPVYHVFELKDGANEEIYEEQAGMMEMVLDMDALCESTKAFRG